MNEKSCNGLVLETDPRVNKQFAEKPYRPISRMYFTEDDYIRREEEFQARMDFLSRSDDRDREIDAYNEKHACKWGNRRIARFVNRYISIYLKKNMPDRTFFLSQLEDIAKENNVALPTSVELEQIRKSPRRRDRIVTELVDVTMPNKVSDYKYYFDGSNVVAYLPGENKAQERELHDRTKWDDLFDLLYPDIKSKYDEKNKPAQVKAILRQKVERELIDTFYNLYDYIDSNEKETCPEFIARKLYNKSAAYAARHRRFVRKKDQVKWTAWWTITYDDKKFGSDRQFMRRLLKKFNNLCVRYKWRIMGVFEKGEENGRLHFHGFFYIPEGSEVGELVEREHYSRKHGTIHKYMSNTEFERDFGINEYEDISEALRSDMNAMAMYTTKMLSYMNKGGRVYYSRHIPIEFIGSFNSHDMLLAYNITCKRSIKRYVVNPQLVVRSDMNISRIEPVRLPDDPVEIGLLDMV